jgi:hypothetical protein
MIPMTVPLKNFHAAEASCTCGCGKTTSPELMLKLQAFIYILERIYGGRVRCNITGPARCTAKQEEVYNKPDVPSYHLGIKRKHFKGEPGAAVDVICDYETKTGRRTIPKAELAKHAIESRLFGGVVHKLYGSEARFLHLDLGPVREA